MVESHSKPSLLHVYGGHRQLDIRFFLDLRCVRLLVLLYYVPFELVSACIEALLCLCSRLQDLKTL